MQSTLSDTILVENDAWLGEQNNFLAFSHVARLNYTLSLSRTGETGRVTVNRALRQHLSQLPRAAKTALSSDMLKRFDQDSTALACKAALYEKCSQTYKRLPEGATFWLIGLTGRDFTCTEFVKTISDSAKRRKAHEWARRKPNDAVKRVTTYLEPALDVVLLDNAQHDTLKSAIAAAAQSSKTDDIKDYLDATGAINFSVLQLATLLGKGAAYNLYCETEKRAEVRFKGQLWEFIVCTDLVDVVYTPADGSASYRENNLSAMNERKQIGHGIIPRLFGHSELFRAIWRTLSLTSR